MIGWRQAGEWKKGRRDRGREEWNKRGGRKRRKERGERRGEGGKQVSGRREEWKKRGRK